MDANRLATTFDYEAFAKEGLDAPTFEHLQGWATQRDPDTITDYDLIKLKARGMMSLAKFKATPTKILKRAYQSPICVGPLPPLHDVKLVLNGE